MSEEDEIIILKIGGSSITNKAQEETLNNDALDWFGHLVAASINPLFLATSTSDRKVQDADKADVKTISSGSSRKKKNTQFIIVHGAGSFGHHSAKRYGLKCGKAAFLKESAATNHHPHEAKRQKMMGGANKNGNNNKSTTITNNDHRRYQMEGLSKTRHSVQKLNAATVNALLRHGVNAVGISPGITFHKLLAHGATLLPTDTNATANIECNNNDCSPIGMQTLCESIQQTLQVGLVPVIHGDACLLYDGERAGILGGDTITEGLATLWNNYQSLSSTGETSCRNKIGKVIFITDVAGVFTSDPKSDKNAELIRSLKVDKDTGKIDIESSKDTSSDKQNNGRGSATGLSNALNVSGSSHAHDVTGGLKAKLGAAVTIVQNGIDVIISQCRSDSTEFFVKGEWESVWDVESGTLLSQQGSLN